MDETPLFMNFPNTKTITKIGSKEVNYNYNVIMHGINFNQRPTS